MRVLWKPAVLLIAGMALIVFGLTRAVEPRCGDVVLRPGMVCEVVVKGAPEQRTYAELAAEARAWRVGAPSVGGVLGAGAVIWTVLLLAQGKIIARRTPEGDEVPDAGEVPDAAPPDPVVHLPSPPPEPPQTPPSATEPWRPPD
ncbi:MAG: hypothetical protein Q4F67_15645 [Propionibacteriaceae bacterium]|nr:hypothetical protein [Propionibacteriaceae bacterium]